MRPASRAVQHADLTQTRNSSAVADKPRDALRAICNGVANPLKHAPPDMRYRAEFSRSMSKGADINRGGEPTKLRSAGATLNGMRGVIDPKKHASPTSPTHELPCRTLMFCVKGCRRRYRRTPKLRTAGAPPLLDGNAADPVKTSLPRHIITTSNLVVLRQRMYT